MIYVTGDKHGNFLPVDYFCSDHHLTKDDTIIVLGDAGLNYYGRKRDVFTKEYAQSFGPTIFCVHGNHEMRPQSVGGYKEIAYRGGIAYREDDFPNLIFAKDGEVYDFDGVQCLVIGGAYSVDKLYRLRNGFCWFSDEQPDEETKERVMHKLASLDNQVDTILSHTCPFKYIPREMFISGIDQSTVDNSTELFLDDVENQCEYRQWLCGHYHTSKRIDKLRFLFHDFITLEKTHE